MEHLQEIDLVLFHLVNGLAGLNATVDSIVMFAATNYLTKGIPVLMIWWGLWFSEDRQPRRIRERLLATLLIAICAIFVGRLLALTLPFRLRPIHDPGIAASLPTNVAPMALEGWSAFPSDHAVLFFALAGSIFLIHRTLGLLLLAHAAVIVGLTRIYAGFHFPSDIVAGAIIGIGVAFAFMTIAARAVAKCGVLRIEERYAYLFYPLLFVLTFQAASMFDSARAAVKILYELVK